MKHICLGVVFAILFFPLPVIADAFDDFVKEQMSQPFRNVAKEKSELRTAYHAKKWKSLKLRLADYSKSERRDLVLSSTAAIYSTANNIIRMDAKKYNKIDIYYLHTLNLGKHRYLLKLAKSIGAKDLSQHQQKFINLYERLLFQKREKPQNTVSVLTQKSFSKRLKLLYKQGFQSFLTRRQIKNSAHYKSDKKKLVKDLVLYGLNYTLEQRARNAWKQADEYRVSKTCIPLSKSDNCPLARQHQSLHSRRGPRPFSKTSHILFYGEQTQISVIFRNTKKGLSKALQKQGKTLNHFARAFPASVKKSICRANSSFLIFAVSGIPHHVFLRSTDGHLLAYAKIDNCKKNRG